MTESVLLGYLSLIAVLIGLAVAIAWILLPFMLVGTKSLLREQPFGAGVHRHPGSFPLGQHNVFHAPLTPRLNMV